MLEKDIIRNVLLNHQYANAHEYAGKYVDQILLEDSSNDDIKYLATKTFRNMIRYELQMECENHTYTGSDFWDVHTMINYFLEQLKLHTIYSNTSADEVRHISETVFFTCFKEDLFQEQVLEEGSPASEAEEEQSAEMTGDEPAPSNDAKADDLEAQEVSEQADKCPAPNPSEEVTDETPSDEPEEKAHETSPDQV